MRLEPRTPGLRVKHLTTEPRGTLELIGQYLQMLQCKQSQIWQFLQIQGEIILDVLIQFNPLSNPSKTLWA